MISERKFLFISSAVIAVLSVAMILAVVLSSSVLYSNDSYSYLAFARSAFEVGWTQALSDFPFMTDTPPLLCLILLGSCKCGCDPAAAGLMVNYLGIILACQGVLFCSFKIYRNRFVALTASLLVCSIPKLYIEGCNIQRDSLFWMESVWLFYLLLCFADAGFDSRKQAVRYYVRLVSFLSVLSAQACLTRKEGIPLLILVFVSFLVLSLRKKNISQPYICVLGFLFISLAALLMYLPCLCGIPFYPGSFLIHIVDCVQNNG